jgi:hypothetical protein
VHAQPGMHCSVALTKAVSHSECGLLVGLKGELLGEHYVPKGKMPYRTEAPSGDVGAVLTETIRDFTRRCRTIRFAISRRSVRLG